MSEGTDLRQISEASKDIWGMYWIAVSPYRTSLWHYCRKLTGSAWNAEDLFQDTLLKGFASLSAYSHRLQTLNVKAYLFRIATNQWIDQCRRWKVPIGEYNDAKHAEPSMVDAVDVNDAVEYLIRSLPIRQAVVFILMESFQFTAKETAELLATTEGAANAALHRARFRLKELRGAAGEGEVVNRSDNGKDATIHDSAVSAFVAAFNRRDFHSLADMLIDEATYSFVAMGSTEYGKDSITRHSLNPNKNREAWIHEAQAVPDTLWGQHVILVVRSTAVGKTLFDVNVIEWEDHKIARWKGYHFCREFMSAAADELGLPLADEVWG